MRKYISLFFWVLIVLCSCNDDRPDDVLNKEAMTNLLIDMHIANGALLSVSSAPDSLYKYGTGKYIAVFQHNKTDSVQFNKSLKYYSLHPEDLLAIYDDVLKELQVRADTLGKILQKENTKNAAQAKPYAGKYSAADSNNNRKGMTVDRIRRRDSLLKARRKMPDTAKVVE